jgi:hypothetical protein
MVKPMSEFDNQPNTEVNEEAHIVDIDAIEEAKRINLPAGWYPMTIEEHEYGLSQSSGQPMWTTKMSVDSGDYAEQKVYNHISWSPKAAPYSKATVAQCFPDLLTNPAYRTANGGLDVKKIGDEAALIGRQVMVKIGFQNYEGEKRNTVKGMKPNTEAGNQFMQA